MTSSFKKKNVYIKVEGSMIVLVNSPWNRRIFRLSPLWRDICKLFNCTWR